MNKLPDCSLCCLHPAIRVFICKYSNIKRGYHKYQFHSTLFPKIRHEQISSFT